MDGGETDIDIVGINRLEVLYWCDSHGAVGDVNIPTEQVFDTDGIKEIVPRLFDDIGGIDEKEKVSIALFIQVENQPRHDEGLATTCRHVEQKMQWPFLAGKLLIKTVEETGKRLFLIGAEFKFRIQIVFEVGGDFFLEKSHLGNSIKLLI